MKLLVPLGAGGFFVWDLSEINWLGAEITLFLFEITPPFHEITLLAFEITPLIKVLPFLAFCEAKTTVLCN